MKTIKKYFEIEEEQRKQYSYPYTKKQWLIRSIFLKTLSNSLLLCLSFCMLLLFSNSGLEVPTMIYQIIAGCIVFGIIVSLVSYFLIRKTFKSERSYNDKYGFKPFENL